LVIVLLLFVTAYCPAGEEAIPSGNVSSMEGKITRGREALAATLSESNLTPEERALLVEAWRDEEMRIERQLRTAQTPTPDSGEINLEKIENARNQP
jgi:isochorismate hydrolase